MTDKGSSQSDSEVREEEKSFKESIIELIVKIKPRLQLLWKKKWSFITFNGIIGILAVLYLLFLTEPYFKSSVVILPDYGNKTSEMLGRFSGLASMAGIGLGNTPPTQIYQNLVAGEAVLSDVIYSKYNTSKFVRPVNLIEYFEIEPLDESSSQYLQERQMFLRLYREMVKNRISFDLDRQTSILTITVAMPEAKLSADVAHEIAISLDEYVRTQRKSYASEQREYLQMRISAVEDTLSMFEEKLKRFREQNRVINQSPQLQLEEGRLMRNVEIQQTVYTELLKQFELAKLEEVKDTPVVNLKEVPKEPILKAGPKRFLILIVIMFFSISISGIYLLYAVDIKKIIQVIKS